MSHYYRGFGLSRREIDNIIEKEVEKNSDLLIGIDDPEVLEMIEVLKSSFARVIEENNMELKDSIDDYIETRERRQADQKIFNDRFSK